jgi:hypothetical protein
VKERRGEVRHTIGRGEAIVEKENLEEALW